MSINIFDAIASRYDMTNHVLALGMDAGWRRSMVRYLPKGNGLKVLDMATGTADVAMILAQDPRIEKVIGVDASEGMLSIGRRKIERASLMPKVELLAGDALALGFPDKHFDAVTVAFGLRNFSGLMRGLEQAYRVIKPGGRLVVLEFSSPRGLVRKYVHGFYLNIMVPLIGSVLTGKKEAYCHLSSTVRSFPSGERFCRIIAQAGFEEVERHELAMGAASIYVGHVGVS